MITSTACYTIPGALCMSRFDLGLSPLARGQGAAFSGFLLVYFAALF
jgi:hypothetical protein